jgi:hypothetical protein
MEHERHAHRIVAGVAVSIGTALAVVAFATAAVADPGNGNGAANGNAGVNGNAYGLANGNNGQAESHQTEGTAGTSGTVTSPQPTSNADDNGVGANVSGPYDSTRDGSPSMNGNGNGNATGEPCAGCVGQADNKNPPGQLPGPSDLNLGYECDGNNGIGKTNPAHTGCVEPLIPPVTPPVTPPFTSQGSINPATEVLGTAITPVQAVPVSAATQPRLFALAFTGSNIMFELLVGLLLLGIGGTALATARFRRHRIAS